ncbi:hypothetical protein NKH77_44225 [Streptomyces sp. M19]
MDQGIAALLGALVGALTTGGATYITAKASQTTQKKQARREAYRTYLQELIALRLRLGRLSTALIPSPGPELPAINPDEIEEKLSDVRARGESLWQHTTMMHLEGPEELAGFASQASASISDMTSRLLLLHRQELDDAMRDGHIQRFHQARVELDRYLSEIEFLANKNV